MIKQSHSNNTSPKRIKGTKNEKFLERQSNITCIRTRSSSRKRRDQNNGYANIDTISSIEARSI